MFAKSHIGMLVHLVFKKAIEILLKDEMDKMSSEFVKLEAKKMDIILLNLLWLWASMGGAVIYTSRCF